MNNYKLIFDFCYLLIYCGAIGYLGKWLSKKTHDKHFAEGLTHAQTIASQLVAKYALDPSVAEGQVVEAVTHDLQVLLDNHGYHFLTPYLKAVVVKEFQHYLNLGGKTKSAPKPAPQEDADFVENKLNAVDNANNDSANVDDKSKQELTDLKTKGLIK